MDASQLWCREIVHSNLKHKFSIFCMPKVSEMHKVSSFYVHKLSEVLHNTPKHHFGSNRVEWMLLNFGTLK
jgi:hypothetical protein